MNAIFNALKIQFTDSAKGGYWRSTELRNNTGILNFEGETKLYGNIGTDTLALKSVTFASSGTSSDYYTQNINKDIYAKDINIGNNLNNTTVNITADTKFNGVVTAGNSIIIENTGQGKRTVLTGGTITFYEWSP